MSSEIRFGHISKSVTDLARDLIVAVKSNSFEHFAGAFYLNPEAFADIAMEVEIALGFTQVEQWAVEQMLLRVLTSGEFNSHLFIDRLYCSQCKKSVCAAHAIDAYVAPNV